MFDHRQEPLCCHVSPTVPVLYTITDIEKLTLYRIYSELFLKRKDIFVIFGSSKKGTNKIHDTAELNQEFLYINGEGSIFLIIF